MSIFSWENRKAYIGRWNDNEFSVVEVRKLTPYSGSIRITKGKEKKQIPLDLNQPTFRLRNNLIFCIDIDAGQIGLKEGIGVPAKLYSKIFAEKTIIDMVSGARKKPAMTSMIFYVIMGLAIGIPSGILLGMTLLPHL